MSISPSIRALYRLIGRIIGRNISDRLANDENISLDPELRSKYAAELIQVIDSLRSELNSTRDFAKLARIFKKLFAKDYNIAIKQLAWILEAYLLLNQSSGVCADVVNYESRQADRLWASNLVDSIRAKILQENNLEQIFDDKFSVNLVLTAHPTAGIQRDYIYHIKNMVNSIEEIASRIEPKQWHKITGEEFLETNIKDILEDLNLSISHMVRSKPYNSEPLTPLDESSTFLDSIDAAWTVIPNKVQSLESELKKYLGNEFRLHKNFFRIHSWVARDIDGNFIVTKDQHLLSLRQEILYASRRYLSGLNRLWQKLGDDFTISEELPTKTYFRDTAFRALYEDALKKYSPRKSKSKQYQAYRVVLEHLVISSLSSFIAKLESVEDNEVLFKVLGSYDLEKDFVLPLEAIHSNKENINTKEIDLLLRTANVFGLSSSHGHTRQGSEILKQLYLALFGEENNNVEFKTKYILNSKAEDIDFVKKLKTQSAKVKQTFELMSLYKYGGIKRQIISMTASFDDMLTTLALTKAIKAFRPSGREAPISMLEIVPLTERISDLRNSYKVIIDALCNPAWNQYLVAQEGRFVTMRGPSDSAKQNGFIASQWEMFRSKQFDSIVVAVFNAYLREDPKLIKAWKALAQEKLSESVVIEESLVAFERFFGTKDFDRDLWEGINRVILVNFDGWGEPVERGGGLEFETTVKCTQPTAANPYYERTLQGGGAQQLASSERTKLVIRDLIQGISEIALRRFIVNKSVLSATKLSPDTLKDIFFLDPSFILMMEKLELILRTSLRSQIIGLDLDDDNQVRDPKILREYFSHVIKSPLIFLDYFNIASRPASRSGLRLKELLNNPLYKNDLNNLAANLPIEDITSLLGDIRAIPYAAMFSLLGGNHVSFCGFDKVLNDQTKIMRRTLLEWIKYFYHSKEDSQESRLVRHMIDSLERGILTADQACYRMAREIIEKSLNPNYKSSNDKLIFKFLDTQSSTINFVAAVKNYKVKDPNRVQINELLQAQPAYRDLIIARRNDAVIPRLGIATAMGAILEYCKANDLNPLLLENIPEQLLDLLRKAFAAGASTFGNGCID